MILMETLVRGSSNPLFPLTVVIWLGINAGVIIRALQAQTRYFQLLQKRQGLKMPTLTDPKGQMPVQTTSFVVNNWRYLPYLVRQQSDTDCELARKLVIRRFLQSVSVLCGSTALFFGLGILLFS